MASPPIPMSDISLDDDDQELLQEAAFFRGSCYWMPCMQSHGYSSAGGSNWWQPIINDKEPGHRWWSKSLITAPFRKIKEWSELIAGGSKWKKFIRRLNKKRRRRPKHTEFHYDPASYSLNFDQRGAPAGCMNDDDLVFRDFSSRYASVPISTKSSSMDLGNNVGFMTLYM